MPLTAAERQRRYKQKLKDDSEKYEEYKKKKRENYHKKKRLVSDLTPKEKYNARAIWRLRKKSVRQNRKNLNQLLDNTPPSSPSILQHFEDPQQDHAFQNLPEQNDGRMAMDMSGDDTPQSSRADDKEEITKQKRGRQKLRRDRSKLYRENLRLQKEMEKLKKKCAKYKKRIQRKGGHEIKKSSTDINTKYRMLSSAIQDRYKKIRKHKEKKILKDIFENFDHCTRKVLIRESLGISGDIRTNVKVRMSKPQLKKTIECFFSRDDVTRATAGKKEVRKNNGEKVQKRFLLDHMKNLFKIFKQDNPGVKCSYYYFTRNKPFYVIKPTVNGREMCLCKTHTNPEYKARALKNKGVINTADMNVLISTTVCDPTVQDCMFGTCTQCRNKQIEPNNKEKNTDQIQWKEWTRTEENYEKEGRKMKAFKNVKKDKEGTIKELIRLFNDELKGLKKHIYNMKVQFKNFRQAVDDMQPTEAVVVVDFSENYNCKLHEEIQAHHFGGSRQQVSLHTVVVYVLTGENERKVESFCTISSNTDHQPAAIWAHLDPVLKNIRSCYPQITTVHFFSDGPFSQYRQKKNFYLCSTVFFDHGFKAITWSFFEAGHGKGPADGVGGYLKRSADELVARGEDISCAEKFYEVLKDVSKIKLYLISSKDIVDNTKQLPPKLQPLPGTKNMHQIFTDVRGELKYRTLSCFCSRGSCECRSPRLYKPVEPVTQTDRRDSNVAVSMAVKKNTGKDVSFPDLVNATGNTQSGCKLSNKDVTMSSDDNQPLLNYSTQKLQRKSPLEEIGFLELSKARNKSLYSIIYRTPETSDDEQISRCQKPSTSTEQNKENRGVRRGDFLLVNVYGQKGKIFKYACVVDDLHDDGEIRVTFLRSTKKKNTFCLEKSDVSDIDYTDIIEILPGPTTKIMRSEKYYVFKDDVKVSEK